MASSPLESDDSDLKKQRHISGGSRTYLLEEGETTGDHSTVHLLSQPMAPTDIISIAAELQSLMLPEMAALIKNQLPDIKKIVKESTDTLSMEIKALREENAKLRADNSKLREDVDKLTQRVDMAETENDALEQYTRRNSVRISGVPEGEGEDTDEEVIRIANELQIHIGPSDIDRSHRIGKPKASGPKPRHRDIIVKFAAYNARQRVYLKRMDLRGSENEDMKGIFINEDLTKLRSKLLFDARSLVRANMLKSAYSADGKIFVRDNGEVRHMIKTYTDILKFGNPDEARKIVAEKARVRGLGPTATGSA